MPYRPQKTSARKSTSSGNHALELPEDFGDYKVACLPIVAHFLQKLGVTSLIDKQVDSPQNIRSGQVVAGMVMDTLAGRSPLYKLQEFFIGQDTELLFGKDLRHEDFNDNNVGKVLDNIHDKRRTRKLDKQLTAEKADFAKLAKATQRETLACKTDADNRVKALLKAHRYTHHALEATVEAEPIYARGRPKAGEARKDDPWVGQKTDLPTDYADGDLLLSAHQCL